MLIGALLAVGVPSLAGLVSGHLDAKGSHLGGELQLRNCLHQVGLWGTVLINDCCGGVQPTAGCD